MPTRSARLAVVLVALAASGVSLQVALADPQVASGAPSSAPALQTAKSDSLFALHVQATDVFQYHPAFNSPFQGANSLKGQAETANTVNAALFVGLHPWQGGQFWLDVEMNQGFAPSNTLGVAGFVNGEGAKVGHNSPYYRPQRLFWRQTIELGGGEAEGDAGLFDFGGETTKNRIVITLGKFSLTDVMDDNQYAHDPENDFLNWALIDTGSFDYAADAWGFSAGGVVEWYQGDWTLRGGFMDLSTVPNQAALTPELRQFQTDLELERRQSWFGREGKIKLLAFDTYGRMGRFDDALRLAQVTGRPPDTALVRRYATRFGVSLNIEQPVSDDGGLFLRAGVDQGQYEPYEYADIDRTVAVGGSLTGARWGRKDDTLALALVVDGISKVHEAYLAAGGLGILVGDGRLPRPGAEAIVEAYYSLAVIKGVHLTLDSQTIVNPAYDRDRGPAEVIGVRLHGQY
jgi:high affinity Mn2+ porin